jgi:hypothetical protein
MDDWIIIIIIIINIIRLTFRRGSEIYSTTIPPPLSEEHGFQYSPVEFFMRWWLLFPSPLFILFANSFSPAHCISHFSTVFLAPLHRLSHSVCTKPLPSLSSSFDVVEAPTCLFTYTCPWISQRLFTY